MDSWTLLKSIIVIPKSLHKASLGQDFLSLILCRHTLGGTKAGSKDVQGGS